jgi:hypothetical protein
MDEEELIAKIKEEGHFKSFKYAGFNCFITRPAYFGIDINDFKFNLNRPFSLNGYIEIPKNNRLYGKKYNEEDFPKFGVDISYSGKNPTNPELNSWVIGFTCDNYSNVRYPEDLNIFDMGYCDMSMMEGILKTLVDQIRKIKRKFQIKIYWKLTL